MWKIVKGRQLQINVGSWSKCFFRRL